MTIEHNISRINYLLKLYGLTLNELLEKISEGLKNPITKDDLYSSEIKISHLKKIDKVFNKGLEYYINPKPLTENKEASIFFRKDKFNSDLNIGAKKIVNQFEDLKNSLTAISKLSDIHFERKIPIYSIKDNPKKVAEEIRKLLYPDEFSPVLRDFLKELISKFAENNIMVFEFIETWNKKDTANINGFYLKPNVIVLKRQQKSFRREIFTLIHELGHYLLNEEEIEEVDVKSISQKDLSKIENWCNEFSYFFLVGSFANTIEKLKRADSSNDYHFDLIQRISRETNLSTLALYTRLLYSKKISNKGYNNVKNELDELYRKKIEEENRKKELDKLSGIKRGGSVPKPINSPLFVNTLQTALYGGVINEYDFCKKLNIKPEKIEKYI
ncbi:ImmA/IrrE family metallo-endopeptidase [Haloflavibacter putidus]|uniref:ImmA/IrrE family metallo-endopeptidase n=1 Tax=Haloflavibacter putidus TaxID=2576776 RepID=A0A507ZC93_9FLAO|nr:ImmA/IrrE family metallo-endopeptidase [Haloflavibacter putidus]TQD34043.1 ImmA/IrrE family metallo-endopeptidase [Haloflavibacter putidus]